MTSSTTDQTGTPASGAIPDEDDAAMATIVDAMLAAAGLHPEPADRDELIVTYAMFRPAIEALYTVPQARYEVPALAFQAAPKLKKW